ncbi:MAG: hypothetical protein GXP10_09590 [Gammaproteobacteria bacterium]|nr:hypothetical protein [Gammaproteobacteria bacterium]
MKKNAALIHRYSLTLFVGMAWLVCAGTAQAGEYKCYVTGADSLHYVVIVDFSSLGMAARAARHVRIDTPNMGRVDVQDVIECRELDQTFRDQKARALDAKTRLDTITNRRQ